MSNDSESHFSPFPANLSQAFVAWLCASAGGQVYAQGESTFHFSIALHNTSVLSSFPLAAQTIQHLKP